MSISFLQSPLVAMMESPLHARTGGGLSRSKQPVSTYTAHASRWGVLGVGVYDDTTPANWSETQPGGASQIGFERPSFNSRVRRRTIVPDPHTLTDYFEQTSTFSISKYTGTVFSNTVNVLTNGNINNAVQFFPTTTPVVVWSDGNVTKTQTEVKTVTMYYHAESGTYSADGGVGYTLYGDVEFTCTIEFVWSNDYLLDDVIADAQAAWTELLSQSSTLTTGSKYVSYDSAGAFANSLSGTGGLLRRSDAPNGSEDLVVAGCSINSGFNASVVIRASRYNVNGQPALYIADYTEPEPPGSAGVTINTRTSQLLDYMSDNLLVAPTSTQVSNLTSLGGCDITLGWPEDYTIPTPDWPVPS